MQKWLLGQGVESPAVLVVLEATGTYWVTLATVLEGAGFVVAPVNPSQAHHFIRSLPSRAKTDQLDAQALAHLGRALTPKAWTPPPDLYHQLQQRLAQRTALIDLRQQVVNQKHALTALPVVVGEVVTRMDNLIVTFDQQLA